MTYNYCFVETDFKKIINYNKTKIRKQIIYFKHYIVPSYHSHDYPYLPKSTIELEEIESGGLDHCHYCWRETLAWQTYFPDKKKLEISELMLNGWRAGFNSKFNVLHIKPHGLLANEQNIERKLDMLKLYSLEKTAGLNVLKSFLIDKFDSSVKFITKDDLVKNI